MIILTMSNGVCHLWYTYLCYCFVQGVDTVNAQCTNNVLCIPEIFSPTSRSMTQVEHVQKP